jgi:hypothetical protein
MPNTSGGCSCWELMWTMEGMPLPPDPERFIKVHALSAAGEVFQRTVECRICHQQWLNSTYPIASEGWRPIRDQKTG